MFKISKKSSTSITLALVVILFFVLTAAIFILPSMYRVFYGDPEESIATYKTMMTCLYISLVPAYAADITLFILLRNIMKSILFTAENVKLLRLISWYCFAECIVFGVLGFTTYTYLVLAFAAAFFGMILRVIKNAFEEAAEIKHENDFTI